VHQRGDATGVERAGGRHVITLAIELIDEKWRKKKYVVDLGGQKSTTKHNNQPKVHRRNKGGKGDDVREWGVARGKGKSIVFTAIDFG
jgi:hypothetical protein